MHRHYFSGSYAKAISRISSTRTRSSFAHTIKEVSLCPVNLATIDGEILAEVSQGYDAVRRDFYLNHLLKELTRVVGLEG